MTKRKNNTKPTKEVINTEGFDKQRFAECVNVMFVLSDLAEGYAMEADALLSPLKGAISPDVVHSINRIKMHSRNLVNFVDAHMDADFSSSFGEVSDTFRGYVETVLIDRK